MTPAIVPHPKWAARLILTSSKLSCIFGILALVCAAVAANGQSSAGSGGNPHLIWQDPLHLRLAQDLRDPSQAPKAPFRFEKEDLGGTNPKIKIKDATGRPWTVKWADENHAEIFAGRLAAAMGYFVRPTFYIREGTIAGTRDLKRAGPFVKEDGQFEDAAFRLVAEDLPYFEGHSWAWVDNPFLDSPEQRRYLNGLKILIMLTSNWDAKDATEVRENEYANTAIYRKITPGQPEKFFYAVDDWGAAMGKWGNFFTREKWNCEAYQLQTPAFIQAVDDDGFVVWGFTGKNSKDITNGITPEDVRWLLAYLNRITDRQLEAALRSSGADQQETQCFGKAVRERITQLNNLVKQSTEKNVRGLVPPKITSR